jgi:hypothetical protein
MTPLGPPASPPARSLAQWWPSLASRHPRRLWSCNWSCHHLEARIEVNCVAALDLLSLALLRQLCQETFSSSTLESLLHLDRAWLHGLLRELAGLGLVHEGVGWEATAAGREAARSGQVSHRCRRRRGFYFVDRSEQQRPPHYLPLASPARKSGEPMWVPAPTGWQLPPGCLEECVQQSPEWKQRFQFPTEVLAVVPPEGPEDWRGVLVDFPQPVLLALIETGAGEGRCWLGFRIQPGSWQLLGSEPVLELRSGWEEVFPDLDRDPPLETWRQEWLRWCQSHSLPAAEVEACVLQRQEHRLVVQAPKRMVERYRGGPRAEALRQEGWLLAGEGRCRAAGQIELMAND